MSSVITPDFIQIPRPVLQSEALQPSDKFLFGYIYWFTKLKMEQCTASNETLGEMTGITPRSVTNALTRLKNSGFIAIKYSGPKEAKKTIRRIDCLVEYRKKLPSNNVSSDKMKLPSNNGRAAIKSSTKEEYIKRNKEDSIKIKRGKTVDNSPKPDHRGRPSPALEKIRQAYRAGDMRLLKPLTNGG